jgi:hypothetical protein
LAAAGICREAIKSAKKDVQENYARLILARVLGKSGKEDEATDHYRHILNLPSRISDESGIPLYLYAAERLIHAGGNLEETAKRISLALEEPKWLSPTEAHLVRGLVEALEGSAHEANARNNVVASKKKILLMIRKIEKIQHLEKDLPRYLFVLGKEGQAREEEPVWVTNGDVSWLLGTTSPASGGQRLLIAVDVQTTIEALRKDKGFSQAFPQEFRFVSGKVEGGESLGPNFPGMKVAFPSSGNGFPSEKSRFLLSFYLLLTGLIVTLTLFGGYLLWKDVRRELKLAEMRSQFVASVSHELKTPLTAIRMFAETLRLGRSKDIKMQTEYLDTIVNESERLSRLLNNVLDFSKIEQGKKIYRLEPNSLYEIIQDAARAMEYPLSQQGFLLRTNIENGLPDILADRDALEQAILNLLSNAMKYSASSREIELTLKRQGQWALIQVTDKGVGIDAKDQGRIFEKFFRIPSPENERLPGTGLGLSLVAHIAKAHGGHVEVESALGRGSTFTIHLPLEKRS